MHIGQPWTATESSRETVRTRAGRRVAAAGGEVHLECGSESGAEGWGGPTCLTRPLERGTACPHGRQTTLRLDRLEAA